MTITFEASGPARSTTAIVFAGDAQYTRYALLAADQIARLHPDRDFDICLCSDGMLEAPPSLAHHGFRFVSVRTAGVFDGLRLDPGRTDIVYLRLALPDAFAGEYRQLLYYDADVFVQRGDFSAFLKVDLGGHVLGAVRDNTQWRAPNRRPEQFRRLGIPARPYFNAGMLMIDVDRFVETRMLARCVAFGREHRDRMIRHDQNLLNGTLQGDWAELAPYWNWQYTRSTMLFEAMEGARVVHFIGPKKPWGHTGGQLPRRFRDAYRDFFATHWPDMPPIPLDGLPPHRNRRYLRDVLVRHVLATGHFCDYLDRFESDLTVLDRR
jgi:lipopolysaccharide biosynthesis glycosyltransferase